MIIIIFIDKIIIKRLIKITQHYRKAVYVITILLLGIGIYGITLVRSSGYMVDDIPDTDPVYIDLKFFEKNFILLRICP